MKITDEQWAELKQWAEHETVRTRGDIPLSEANNTEFVRFIARWIQTVERGQ